MFTELSNIDIALLDKLLWLSSPPLMSEHDKHPELYFDAAQLGSAMALKYPIKSSQILSELERYNVKAIKAFKQDYGDRAYYLPNKRTIFVNTFFLSDMVEYFKSQNFSFFSYDNIYSALVLHEFFHHIEESLHSPVDIVLKDKYNVPVSAIYRDIAAFAFVNAQIEHMVCQLIDLYWLKKFYPDRYLHIETIYQNNII